MKTSSTTAAAIVLLMSALTLTACSANSTGAGSTAALSAEPDDSNLRVNGKTVPATHQSLLEVLLTHQSVRRIGLQAPGSEQPAVLIDGVLVSAGMEALAGIPAFHVSSVNVLHPVDATPLYGSIARYGAIVVKTR